MYDIKVIPEFGRGIHASRSAPKGTVLFLAEILQLSEQDTITVNSTDLKHYTFKLTDTTDCLVLGDGELFNHSDTPNISYNLISYKGRTVMEFRTTKKVSTGEQYFIDYSADTSTVNISSYVAAPSLIG